MYGTSTTFHASTFSEHLKRWNNAPETTKLTKELAVARAMERPLSVALNGRLKSKRQDFVARVKMGNLQVNKTGGKPVERTWGLYAV